MRKTLSKTEIWDLNNSLRQRFGVDIFGKKDLISNVDNKYLLVNDEPYFFMHEKQWVPTLKLMIKNPFLKKVEIDMGAIKFIIGGADLMRPGIVFMDAHIVKDDYVLILDTTHKKPIAIGQALFDAKEIDSYSKGRVFKNIHYVGDDIWNVDF